MAIAIINCKRTDVNVVSPDGDTPLHAAVSGRATNSLAALIARAPKMDVLDAGGCTALHRAAYAACVAREREAEKRALMLVKGRQVPRSNMQDMEHLEVFLLTYSCADFPALLLTAPLLLLLLLLMPRWCGL